MRFTFVIAVLVTVTFISCNKKQEITNVITVNKMAKEKSVIPKPLNTLDINSEALYQSVMNSDWLSSEKDYQKVNEEFYNLSPYLIKDSVPNDYISALDFSVKELDINIKNKNKIGCLTESNNITKYICDIADYFITDYPSNLRRIHVFSRNVEIFALQDKWDESKENFNKINAFWPKVKDLLSAKSAEKVKAFENSLLDFEYLLNKKDLSKLLKQTRIIRDRIDDLEYYYEN